MVVLNGCTFRFFKFIAGRNPEDLFGIMKFELTNFSGLFCVRVIALFFSISSIFSSKIIFFPCFIDTGGGEEFWDDISTKGIFHILRITGSVVTFCQFFRKNLSLPAWANTSAFVLTYTLKCPREKLPLTTTLALQRASLKGLLLMISKARKVICGPGAYSHGLDNIACFCSLLL